MSESQSESEQARRFPTSSGADAGGSSDQVEVRDLHRADADAGEFDSGDDAAAGDAGDDDAGDETDADSVALSEEMDGYQVWHRLWFIQLSDESGAKMPADAWGGYNQDFEAVDTVYTAEEVAASDHDRWGVVGFNAPEESPTDPQLLVFDLDLHEEEAPDRSEIGVGREGAMMGRDPVVVESQSGGLHMYALVDEPPVKESAFNAPEWIDIRGESVKHHVVAPTEVPGVDTQYELRNAASIPEFGSYTAACEMVRVGGDPVLEYAGSRGAGADATPSYSGDPPEGMPTCYQQALAARAEASFREAHGNPWKVDTLAAQLGIALGYDVETVADHFEQHPKGGDASEFDRNLTVNHLRRLARKMRGDAPDDLRAPSALTLRGHGVLGAGESCSCDLHRHHDPDTSGCSEYYAYLGESYDSDAQLLRACVELRDEYEELEDADPPYAALKEIARRAGLSMEDDGTLGETTWRVARSAFDDLDETEL